MARFELNDDQITRLQAAIQRYPGMAGKVIDQVLHEEGGPLIRDEIMRLLPESGRTWQGKRPAAKSAQPFVQDNGSLSVTIRTKPAYHYLYFPDDGTSTKRHVGYQGKPREFMSQGAENKAAAILDKCIAQLIQEWEE